MDAHNYNWFSRFCFSLGCVALVFCVGAAASEPLRTKEAETVYVAVEQARLYAGPSADFYPTGNIARGSAIEVHHRTTTGWLGIRPTQGSFSWVPASQAYLLPGGRVIEVTDANAVSWIGTEFGSAKQYRWQVKLSVGEQLGVLGEASVKNGPDEREALWYKVSPPAGEFRWIEESAVSKTPVQTSSTTSATSSQVAAINTQPPAEPAGKDNAVQQANFNAAMNNSPKATAAEQTAAPEKAAPVRTAQATTKRKSQPSNSQPTKPQAKPGSEWDGWYAFEMSNDGVKTPFLDKLSGRDRGQTSAVNKPKSAQHDPLQHDPFSLSMAGDASAKPTPEELSSSIRNSREWRDPRTLREARLASNTASPRSLPLESFVDRFDRAVTGTSGVLPASGQRPAQTDNFSTPNIDSFETGAADRSLPQQFANTSASFASSATVNWYGLSEASNNAPNVVTSADDVAELQVALNNSVANSSGPWNLAPLAERAKYFIEHGATAVERGQARLLLERIEAFQNLAARSQQLSGPQLPSQPPVQSASYVSPSGESPNALPSNSAKSNYDATGWLVPVHAAGPDQPTHAITNDTGDIVAYVSPIPGLNLDRYRNQPVGITGLRGYLPQLQAAHIQAQRVSRIR